MKLIPTDKSKVTRFIVVFSAENPYNDPPSDELKACLEEFTNKVTDLKNSGSQISILDQVGNMALVEMDFMSADILRAEWFTSRVVTKERLS